MPLIHVSEMCWPLSGNGSLFLSLSLATIGEFLEGGVRSWKETTIGPVVSLEAQTQRKDGVEVVLQKGLFFPLRTSQLLSGKGRILPFNLTLCSSCRWPKCMRDFSSVSRGLGGELVVGGRRDPDCPVRLHGDPVIQVLPLSGGGRSSER